MLSLDADGQDGSSLGVDVSRRRGQAGVHRHDSERSTGRASRRVTRCSRPGDGNRSPRSSVGDSSPCRRRCLSSALMISRTRRSTCSALLIGDGSSDRGNPSPGAPLRRRRRARPNRADAYGVGFRRCRTTGDATYWALSRGHHGSATESGHRDAPAPWRCGARRRTTSTSPSGLPPASTPPCSVPQPLVRHRRHGLGGSGRIRPHRLRVRQRAACPRRRPRATPLRHSHQAARTVGEVPRRPSARRSRSRSWTRRRC